MRPAAPASVRSMPVPRRLELVEELVAAGLLVGLADGRRTRAQPVERAEEAPVGLVLPPHVARAPPAGLAQPVEAAVVADPEVRVRLDRVAGELDRGGPSRRGTGATARPPAATASRRAGSAAARAPRRGARARRRARDRARSRAAPAVDSEIGWSVTGRRLWGAPVEFGSVTVHPEPDSSPRRLRRPRPRRSNPKPTRLVLARHAVTAQTGPMLSGRAPGIDLSDTGPRAGEGARRAAGRAAGRGRLRQPDRAHHADRRGDRAAPRAHRAAAARA